MEWTNQHGCGGNEDDDPHKLNCNLVLQYMVQDYDGMSQDGRWGWDDKEAGLANNSYKFNFFFFFFFFFLVTDSNDDTEWYRLRNGVNTNTQQHNTPGDNEQLSRYRERRMNSVRYDRGLHESMDYYDDCTKRERNPCKSCVCVCARVQCNVWLH